MAPDRSPKIVYLSQIEPSLGHVLLLMPMVRSAASRASGTPHFNAEFKVSRLGPLRSAVAMLPCGRSDHVWRGGPIEPAPPVTPCFLLGHVRAQAEERPLLVDVLPVEDLDVGRGELVVRLERVV